MKFTTHKRRHPPAIIIVSLIDVLIVVLIFLVVSTTFKSQPNIKLVLPESKQAKAGATENPSLTITIDKTGTFYFEKSPVTAEKLQEKLVEAVKQNPQVNIGLKADEGAPWGRVVRVMDAAKTANIKVNAVIKSQQ